MVVKVLIDVVRQIPGSPISWDADVNGVEQEVVDNTLVVIFHIK
jgi:hypothetical protein